VPSIPIYPPTLIEGGLIGKNVKFLLAQTNKRWPHGIDPGDHHFLVLNTSFDKESFSYHK
jgi:hypothetical protein